MHLGQMYLNQSTPNQYVLLIMSHLHVENEHFNFRLVLLSRRELFLLDRTTWSESEAMDIYHSIQKEISLLTEAGITRNPTHSFSNISKYYTYRSLIQCRSYRSLNHCQHESTIFQWRKPSYSIIFLGIILQSVVKRNCKIFLSIQVFPFFSSNVTLSHINIFHKCGFFQIRNFFIWTCMHSSKKSFKSRNFQ